jgi:hypothetical protein
MNKSIAVSQLQLPNEITEFICSFIFYSVAYTIEQTKQRYKFVLLNISDIVIKRTIMFALSYNKEINQTYIITLIKIPSENKIRFITICEKCGQYRKCILRRSPSCLC